MKTSAIFRTFGSTLLLVMLAACASPDRGYVQREWSRSLRELGIVPVFPPREDIVVGDVYAYPYDPDSLKTESIFLSRWTSLSDADKNIRSIIGMSPRLARIDLSDPISKEYSSTISAPATTPDYNGIVGNPALEAASQKVSEAESKLAALKGIVATASKAVADADAKLLTAKRKREDEQTNLNKAQANLTAAQAAPIDTSAESGALKKAKDDLSAKDRAVVLAQRALDDAADGDKANATKALLAAKREQEDATTAVTRAQAALDAKLAQPRNVDTEKAALAAQKDVLDAATKSELDATREKENATSALTAATAAQTAPIAEATTALDNAKALRTAIGQAGARMLYAQPRDGKKNVYTGKDLDSTSSPDDASGSRTNRLRLVGFPEFSTTSFTQGDLSALIPVEAMGIGINVSSTNVKSVSVKVPAAESYGLSLDQLLPLIVDIDSRKLTDQFTHLIKIARAQTNKLEATEGTIYLRVFAEVYYARALDISIFAADSFGARAQVTSPATLIGAQSTAADSSKIPAMTPSTINSSAAGSAVAGDMLASMQSRLGTTQTVPGGSIQLVNYSDKSIGLRRVFDRPIAIGVRALSLTYDLATDKVSGIQVSDSVAPAGNPQ